MPEISQQNPSEPSNIGDRIAEIFREHSDSFFFESTEMKNLLALFKEKNTKETQLNQLDKMEKMTTASLVNNQNVPDIYPFKLRFTTELENNEQQIEAKIKKILANNQHKSELRKLASRNVQLIDVQAQLVEAFSEEIINEEEVQNLKSLINAELDIFYSEPVRELYRLDFQTILQRGISESDLSYLRDLSQSDETIRLQAENKIADYYMQVAEEQIAKRSFLACQMAKTLSEKSVINNDVLSDGISLYEDEPMPPLYTADSANAVYELLLNGADPVKESKNLEITPLTKLFESRYVIQQQLNRVEAICMPSIKAQINAKFGEQILRQHYTEDKEALENDLNNQIQTLRAEVEQPELKIDLETWTKELDKEAQQLKLNLSNDSKNQIKALKNEVKALSPALKKELKSQYKLLKTEAEGLKLELENNAALIKAHIKGILLRDVDAQVSDYPDIVSKKEFQQTWNNCKQEIKELQQTQLTEYCTAYDFLTRDLAELPDIKAKTLKSVIKHFPEYEPVLHKQNDLLNNYRLVQGPQVTPKKPVSLAENTVKHSLKVTDASKTNTRETPEAIEKIPANNQLIQASNITRKHRLIKCTLFTGIVESTESTPTTEPTPEKTSEPKRTGSRLNRIPFSNNVNSFEPSLGKEKLTHRTICYTK
ncbi:MAG: hypothetical protein RLY40_1203 [Pseudomonadota bacterium]|jgi:hypothetical protein